MSVDLLFGIAIGFALFMWLNAIFSPEKGRLPSKPALPTVSVTQFGGVNENMEAALMACGRGTQAKSHLQYQDAFRSARTFIDAAEADLERLALLVEKETTIGGQS